MVEDEDGKVKVVSYFFIEGGRLGGEVCFSPFVEELLGESPDLS